MGNKGDLAELSVPAHTAVIFMAFVVFHEEQPSYPVRPVDVAATRWCFLRALWGGGLGSQAKQDLASS